ncbi:TPA: adenylate/guanylate cyclase domain-containing protein, partial [Legionella pneumophila]|nr:adenylate/guanylate cyclase domain-containing protein [Legionella pneumophila]
MASYSKLPLRIRKEIEAQQYTGELLVAGVQLGVIILLSIINLFSSAGYSPGAPVQSSSLGLWLFAILVLVRLWFVYTNQLNPIFLGFFIV